MNGRRFRHSVDAYRPPANSSLTDRGQLSGSDTLLASGIPCLVEQLQSNELIAARQQYPSATHRVTTYADSQLALNEKCYLKLGTRQLDIAGIIDPQGDGRFWTIVCGEKK